MTKTRQTPKPRTTGTAEPASSAAPPPTSPDEDDEDDDEEETEDSGDDEDDDEEPEETEAQRELREAEATRLAQFKAGQAARDEEVLKQRARGGDVNYDRVHEKQQAAEERVGKAAIAARGPGVYVKSAIVVADEKGNRIQLPPGARIPDAIVRRLSSKRHNGKTDLERMGDEVIEDLRRTG